jgi:hypothetical protein
MRASVVLLALGLAAGGCSCRSNPALPPDTARADSGLRLDASTDAAHGATPPDRGPEAGPQLDGPHPGHPEEDWAVALDVPWGSDGTRPLAPIEISPAVSAIDCGQGCQQVTFLPGARSCLGFGEHFSVDGDYLTTAMAFPQWKDGAGNVTHRCMQAYVDLRTLKAYAFGTILAGPGYSGCGNGKVSAGRIGYGCNGSVTTTNRRAELRVFDIESRFEGLLWNASTSTELDMPMSIAFAGADLAVIMSPACASACNAVLLVALTGGPRRQIYPAASDAPGGVRELAAAFPYVVFRDGARYYPGLRDEIVAIDLRQPDVPIDLSNQAADQFTPRISGTNVVWGDVRNDPSGSSGSYSNSDVYLKDLLTSEERAICTHTANQDSPDIEGETVVWRDCRDVPAQPGCDPYVLNLGDGVEHRVVLAGPPYRYMVRINGGRLFFLGGTADTTVPPQIYMVDLRQLGLVGP